MEKQKKKYKRVMKRQEMCANPLFEKWLDEWKTEAANKGWKSERIYAKALISLRKYPLSLKSGKEARILEFFGEKICKMLDDKLRDFVAKGGILPNSDVMQKGDEEEEKEEEENGDDVVQVEKESQPSTFKSRRVTKKREYVPLYRSGAYALLVTLYKNYEINGSVASMKKVELMDEAQPFCDKSFRLPDPGGFYTAWSSMGILIRKGFVLKESSPAKYSLTENGMKLAEKLLNAERNKSKFTTKNCNGSNVLFVLNDATNVSSQEKRSETSSQASSSQDSRFQYCYVSESGVEINRKDEAMVSIDDAMVGFLIKCKKDALFMSGRCFKMDTTRPSSGDFVFAFLHNHYADDVISPADFLSTENAPTFQSSTKRFISSGSQFCLYPEQFEIILCVDNCETLSSDTNSRRLIIQNDLRKNGINFDVRKLHVGDYAWIAREKQNSSRNSGHRELVLDYIVERKRMDDLACSIKDGRFHEQKSRLKECGVQHVIYLVEEMGITGVASLPEATLNQAIINTQIIDEFLVKRTPNTAASVTYLSILTRFLQTFYANKILASCCKEEVKEKQQRDTDERCNLMTFDEFNSSSIKNRDMIVGDLFLKQLVQLSGLSMEKAIAITDQYPTPASLIDAYGDCETVKKQEELVANIKFGQLNRNVGISISRSLFHLYCKSK